MNHTDQDFSYLLNLFAMIQYIFPCVFEENEENEC